MDKDIKVLEKIGLQEVCKKTHIEVKQLEFMVNRQYDKLNKINTLGFVKILSREYKLDLADWLEGFYAYWAENDALEDAQKEKIFIRAKGERNYKKIMFLFIPLIVCFGVYKAFSVLNIEIDIAGLINKAKLETSITGYQSAPVVQEAAKSIGVKVEERKVESNSTNGTSVEAVVVNIDENVTEKIEVSTIAKVEKNGLNSKETPKNIAILLPKRKIWVGTVFLDDFSRTITSDDKNITIDLTKRQLIKTGNGYFRLSYDGTVEDFDEQGSSRFLVENGAIKKISEAAFIEYNKGKNW